MSDGAPYSDPETTFLREARPLGPITRPAIRPDRLDSGIPLPSSPAAPVPFASTEFEDFLEPSDTMNRIWIDRLFVKWQSWARDKKISTAKREKIMEATRAAADRLGEARRKSLSSCSETSSMSDVAPSPDPPMPEYAPFGRKSSISPPDAHFTAQGPIPDPPPRDVPPSPSEASLAATEDVRLDAAIRASLLDAPPPRRHNDSTLTTLPPHLPDASSPRRHDDLTSTTLPHRPDASSPRRHDDPTLQTLPPRRHGYPPSPPSSIAASDVPPESVDSSDFYPYRKTFSCDIKDLPAELASHSFHHTIECLLKSEPDSTNRYWCRRSTYTEDNFEQWVEWSPPSKTHRDERACMKDLDTDTLLKAPGLLATDKKVLEDAWGTYRPYLLDQIQQALSVGCDWKRILQRLNLAFSDPKRGYPRLEQYVGQALRDRVLIKFPLLHADVLIYQLDRTYSEKGTHNPNYTRWSRTFLRESGEDVSSLANRVESAYLDMLSDGPGTENSRKFTKETIYQRHDAESCRISSDLYERFRECLRNDVDNPARGLYLELMCEQEEDRLLADYEKNRARLRRMDGVMPEQLEQLEIVSKPPTLEDLAIHVSAQSVERHGNTHNHYSADVSDPHLVSFIGQCEDSQGTPGFRLSRPGGTYRVPPRKSGDFTWRNQPDFWVLVDARTEPPPKSDFAELVDADDGSSEDENDEESYKNHRGGRPRSHMNSRDRRRVARQHLQLERKPQKPSKPPSYNAEPPPKSYNTEPPPKGYNAEPNHD